MTEARPSVGHPRSPSRDDIVSFGMTDHETWYECSVCGRTWRGSFLPGIIHHYIVCARCRPREAVRD